MEIETSLTKAELLRVIKTYQDALFKIKDYCDNLEQFKDEKYVRNIGDCYASALGAVGFQDDYVLGLYD